MSGKLSANCSGVYFPATLEPDCGPVPQGKVIENTVTLTWSSEGGNAFTGVVLFKVKSSTPTRFHVHPRYGVIEVVDGIGKATDVTISLRGTDGGLLDSSQTDLVNSEKFLVEYFTTARPDVVSAFHNNADGAPPKRVVELYEQLKPTPVGKILLRGFLDCVFTEEQLKFDPNLQDRAVVFIVPSGANLAYQAKLSSRLSIRTQSMPQVNQSEFHDQSLEPAPVPTPATPTPRSSSNLQRLAEVDDETHKLRVELDHLRQQLEIARRDKKEIEAAVAASKRAEQKSAHRSEKKESSEFTKKKGVPFLAVVMLMLLTFVATFYCRVARGWGGSSPFAEEGISWPLG